MKKFFFIVCLFLCVKSYSQNSVLDNSLITYKDVIHGISFKYPATWDSTLYNRSKEQSGTAGSAFGAVFPFENSTYQGSFTYYMATIPEKIDIQMILENTEAFIYRHNPKALIEDAKIIESKNKIKYVYVKVKGEIMKGITSIKYICANHSTIFNLEFVFRENYFDKHKNVIKDVADSFQFNK